MECIRRKYSSTIVFGRILISLSRRKSSSIYYCVDTVRYLMMSLGLILVKPLIAKLGMSLSDSLVGNRKHDYENFLATLLLHESVRTPSLVVRAFNVEVARVQDQTTDKHTAEFRLQFWKDTIAKIFKSGQLAKNIPANPIAQQLFNVHSSGIKISKRHLERLITSRHDFLRTKYFRTLDEVEKYSEETVSMLYYLTLSIANIQNVHADHAASHLGKAQGIVNLLRSVHVSSAQKTVTLPLDILTKHSVSQEDVLRTVDSKQLREVAFELASRANAHLDKARHITVAKEARPIFLPAVAVDSYLTRLQKVDFNIYDKSLLRRRATLPLVMYYKKILHQF